jgi:hypothetical protein
LLQWHQPLLCPETNRRSALAIWSWMRLLNSIFDLLSFFIRLL